MSDTKPLADAPLEEPVYTDNVRPLDRAKEKLNKTREVVGEGLETAREKVKTVAADMEGQWQKASENAQRVSETARERAREAGQVARERAREAGQVARERYAVASEQLREGYGRAREDAADLADDVNDYVRENPGRSVLVAAAAGFVIGMLLRRR